MTALRLLSFNIHGGRAMDGRRDLARINALLDEYAIDIGIFQEMETRATNGGSLDDVARLAGPARPFSLAGPGLRNGEEWYGNLIVSRYPILRGAVHNLASPVHVEPRTAIDAAINTPFGKIRIINTHLSLSSPHRWLEINSLLKFVDAVEEEEENPLLLMGDINEWRWTSPVLRHLNKIMTPVPMGRSFPSFFPALKLDRVWHDAPGLTITARILDASHIRILSDHLPVLVEITYPSTG